MERKSWPVEAQTGKPGLNGTAPPSPTSACGQRAAARACAGPGARGAVGPAAGGVDPRRMPGKSEEGLDIVPPRPLPLSKIRGDTARTGRTRSSASLGCCGHPRLALTYQSRPSPGQQLRSLVVPLVPCPPRSPSAAARRAGLLPTPTPGRKNTEVPRPTTLKKKFFFFKKVPSLWGPLGFFLVFSVKVGCGWPALRPARTEWPARTLAAAQGWAASGPSGGGAPGSGRGPQRGNGQAPPRPSRADLGRGSPGAPTLPRPAGPPARARSSRAAWRSRGRGRPGARGGAPRPPSPDL